MINRSIAARQKSAEPGEDLLSMLLAARDTEGDGTGMTAKQLRDEAVTLFNAGHDTTATTLSWTWYLLMKHPDIYERLLLQIDTVLGADSPTPSDIAQIPLLTAILKESMRLYPAAWILPRQCNNDLELGGYSLSKGSLVNLFPYILQRDSRFFDDPNSFLPERFLPDNEKKLHPFAHIPFGAGPRACIGKDFAMMEMQLLIIEICKKFRFYLQKPNETIQPNPLISLEPRGGIKAVVTVRERN
jgi:cytochrome P450